MTPSRCRSSWRRDERTFIKPPRCLSREANHASVKSARRAPFIIVYATKKHCQHSEIWQSKQQKFEWKFISPLFTPEPKLNFNWLLNMYKPGPTPKDYSSLFTGCWFSFKYKDLYIDVLSVSIFCLHCCIIVFLWSTHFPISPWTDFSLFCSCPFRLSATIKVMAKNTANVYDMEL